MRFRERKAEAQLFMPKKSLSALFYAAREHGTLHYLALFTQYLLGLRVGELILLRYEHLRVNPDGSLRVMVPTLKKGKRRHCDTCEATGKPLFPVPVLSHENIIRAAFDRRYRRGHLVESPWLFPAHGRPEEHWSRSNALRVFYEARDAANIGDYYGSHSLRHSAATYLAERCQRQRMVSAFLRHSLGGRYSGEDSPAVTARYVHLTDDVWKTCRGALDVPPLAPFSD